jgi:hypothetical protein
MLLGGKGGCQQCTCVPCEQCTRTCQNPHTGAAFEVVGRGFSPEIGDEGAVSGRLTDGYLTASGNFDADMNGMSGGGPYYQQVGGTFYLDSTQTRFPCSVAVAFWRNTFTSSDPPASAELTGQRITISCVMGSFRISPIDITINAGESYSFDPSNIPLSTTGDPRAGGVGGFALCDGTMISIQARIEWNVQPRVHILLGIVRECYELFDPCGTICNGAPAPEIAYVTISNYTGPAKDSPFAVEGTYVLERIPNTCEAYSGDTPNEAGCQFHPFDTYMRLVKIDGVFKWFWRVSTKLSTNPGVCDELWVGFVATVTSLCEPDSNGEIESGSGGSVALGNHYEGGLRYVFPDATFDWKIEV